jgi:T-complex protein 1 subunit alpha
MGTQGPLSIRGTRESGQDVRSANVTAVVAVANVVKSSLGPVGLDKMLVDDIGDVCITNDGATILKQLEVEHPAAKILVELANLQDQEVGDGTTSVVIVAAELLKRAHNLVKNKIHPTSIISGYRIAMKEAIKFVESHMAMSTDTLGEDILLQCAKTSMSSKIIGAQEDYFARMAVEAVQAVKTIDDIGNVRYPVKAINVLKAHGRSLMESQLIKGYALNMGRAAQGMPTQVTGAKIACVDFNLQKHRMHMGIQIQVTDPKALAKIRDEEMNITARRIRSIIDAGANVILTTKGIDDYCLKLLVDAGCIGCRRVPKDDMKRICRSTGATLVTSLATEDGGEKFDAACLGSAESVFEDRISDDDMVFLQGCGSTKCGSSHLACFAMSLPASNEQ